MDLYDASIELATLLETNRTVFVRTEPEVLDFTDSVLSKVIVCGTNSQVELELSSSNTASVMGLLDATIFNKDLVGRCYFWDFKSLASFCKYHTTKFVTPKNSVIDLKVIEAFLDIHKKPPANFVEASNRASVVAQNTDWPAIYKSIHLPLSLRVLPTIETTALLDSVLRRSVHPYYEIEGQRHGRLNCSSKFSRSYLPHTMGPDVKKSIKPKGYGLRFATADFRYCEVVVLQWLTGDEKLKEILDSGEDLHCKIYEVVTGNTCDTEIKRRISKKMFLPVVYGLGTKGLSQALSIPIPVAEKVKSNINSVFSTAMDWVGQKQQIAIDGGIVKDHFGRPRKYAPEESYLARNIVIQGVAATVCQEKMISLWTALKDKTSQMAFTVHDGYCVITPTQDAKDTYTTIKDTLEAESKLCPGLKMSVEIKFGVKLDEMKTLWTN